MGIKDKINLVICLMLALGGSLFVTIAVREWFVTWKIIQLGEKTQGIVVENVRRPRKVGDKGTPMWLMRLQKEVILPYFINFPTFTGPTKLTRL